MRTKYELKLLVNPVYAPAPIQLFRNSDLSKMQKTWLYYLADIELYRKKVFQWKLYGVTVHSTVFIKVKQIVNLCVTQTNSHFFSKFCIIECLKKLKIPYLELFLLDPWSFALWGV